MHEMWIVRNCRELGGAVRGGASPDSEMIEPRLGCIQAQTSTNFISHCEHFGNSHGHESQRLYSVLRLFRSEGLT